jgi:hypothetical protein
MRRWARDMADAYADLQPARIVTAQAFDAAAAAHDGGADAGSGSGSGDTATTSATEVA